ncbi:hypothetical protein NC652_029110 [Populus alba x Populus x berolinensis]|nr:hypothetical protein NC652_029101 [Populus alba x Populus x berolinensis]KAJ6887997.1 hypothetical protein NC652_029110 [Populus alba x Populus x berolinensis]
MVCVEETKAQPVLLIYSSESRLSGTIRGPLGTIILDLPTFSICHLPRIRSRHAGIRHRKPATKRSTFP